MDTPDPDRCEHCGTSEHPHYVMSCIAALRTRAEKAEADLAAARQQVEALRGLLEKCRPHVRMNQSVTSGREFREATDVLLSEIATAIQPSPNKPSEGQPREVTGMAEGVLPLFHLTDADCKCCYDDCDCGCLETCPARGLKSHAYAVEPVEEPSEP